jgi:ATP-binding cassette subfamily B protein
VSFPYLTKDMMDKGILSKSYSLVLLFAIAQIILFISSTIVDILRSWLLLHVNAKMSLSIVSDFLRKLMKLPIRYFDSKSVGDISQRINDHNRIENFLTQTIVSSFFSVLQIFIFSFILFFYSFSIWLVFMAFSFSAIFWIFLFQKKRKKIDYIRFSQTKNSQEKLYEMVVGMQEIKLFSSEDTKRWEWEFMQQRMYKLNIKSLILEQYQQNGFAFLSYLKNIIISYLTAVYVINGHLSLGIMMSISFIIGQTNGPLQQLVSFLKTAQDANISVDRLQEVHQKEDEEKEDGRDMKMDNPFQIKQLHHNIHLENLSFQYQGPRSQYVLKNINLIIPKGKITAFVGSSGSGKTTLIKLLLGFYTPVEGRILVGENELKEISPKGWRCQCGTVMQDGYIFTDTISKNIAPDGLEIDANRLQSACKIANTDEFVNQLPLRYSTKIGTNGIGLSGGQKQRILIARAVYKNPHYLFFDEATSSLDAKNESAIMEGLIEFFIGKTVVIVAHRLSTVKNADQIIVLEKGQIVEIGNHNSLVKTKGKYFELVKNQLELGD